eukprot:TRINITY_DN4840_c0_g1_i1.p1 TRINITY_DN4840_c0_g1~~TRINITY_DN4840_c0_g1_i1.p1  ORF type:complete len:1144 (-),score=201.95 TRINITY_DN4840_c0_g1_i1:81-3512(-)
MPGPHVGHVHSKDQRLAAIEATLARLSELSEGNVLQRLAALEEKFASVANEQVVLQEPATDAKSAQQDEEEVPEEPNAEEVMQVLATSSPKAAGGDDRKRYRMTRVTPKLLDEETEETYTFGESVWDIAIFIGTPALGVAGSLQTIILVLASIGMQAVFVMIAYFNFLEPAVSQETLDDVKTWRVSSGHDLNNYDAVTGSSLIARVCGNDGSLSVSGSQMTLSEDIKAYLQSEVTDPFQAMFNGQLLCLVALICWFLMVAKEMNHALALHRATIHVPVGPNKFRPDSHAHYVVHSLTRFRRIVSWLILLYRAVSASLLVYVGVHFLVNTINVEDLILNAVALGIILDIDDLIFDALATAPSRHLVHNLKPLPMKSFPRIKGADLKSLIMSSALAAIIVYIQCYMLSPNSLHLESLSRALCGDNRDFVWSRDARSIVMFAPTTPYDEDVSSVNAEKVERFAVNEAIQNPSTISPNATWKYAIWTNTAESLKERVSASFSEINEVSNRQCEDLASGPGPYLAYLQEALGDTSIKSCSDARNFCSSFEAASRADTSRGNGFSTRMFCPVTCGCDDPTSLQVLTSGCPMRACRGSKAYQDRLRTGFCSEDVPSRLRKEPLWINWVNNFRNLSRSAENFTGRSELAIVAEAMWEHGCDFTARLTGENLSWGSCAAWNPQFDWSFETPSFMCPRSCQCFGQPPAGGRPSNCPLPEVQCVQYGGPGPDASVYIDGDVSIDIGSHTDLIQDAAVQAKFKTAVKEMIVQVLDMGINHSAVFLTSLTSARLLSTGDLGYQAARRLATAKVTFKVTSPYGNQGDRAVARFQSTAPSEMTAIIVASMQSLGAGAHAQGIMVASSTSSVDVQQKQGGPSNNGAAGAGQNINNGAAGAGQNINNGAAGAGQNINNVAAGAGTGSAPKNGQGGSQAGPLPATGGGEGVSEDGSPGGSLKDQSGGNNIGGGGGETLPENVSSAIGSAPNSGQGVSGAGPLPATGGGEGLSQEDQSGGKLNNTGGGSSWKGQAGQPIQSNSTGSGANASDGIVSGDAIQQSAASPEPDSIQPAASPQPAAGPEPDSNQPAAGPQPAPSPGPDSNQSAASSQPTASQLQGSNKPGGQQPASSQPGGQLPGSIQPGSGEPPPGGQPGPKGDR